MHSQDDVDHLRESADEQAAREASEQLDALGIQVDPRPLHRVAVVVEAREDHADPPWTDEDLLEAVQATLHEVFPLDYDKGGSSMMPVVPTVTRLHEADRVGRPPQLGEPSARWHAWFERVK